MAGAIATQRGERMRGGSAMTVSELLEKLKTAVVHGYGNAVVRVIDPGDHHYDAVFAYLHVDAEETIDGDPDDVSFQITTD